MTGMDRHCGGCKGGGYVRRHSESCTAALQILVLHSHAYILKYPCIRMRVLLGSSIAATALTIASEDGLQ